MTDETEEQDRAIVHALTQEIKQYAADMIEREVTDGYACAAPYIDEFSLQIKTLDMPPRVIWYFARRGISVESEAFDFEAPAGFRAAAIDALADLCERVTNHMDAARGLFLYGAELVAHNEAGGDDITSVVDPKPEPTVKRQPRTLEDIIAREGSRLAAEREARFAHMLKRHFGVADPADAAFIARRLDKAGATCNVAVCGSEDLEIPLGCGLTVYLPLHEVEVDDGSCAKARARRAQRDIRAIKNAEDK